MANSPTDWHAWSRLAPPEAFEAFLEDVRRGERTHTPIRFLIEISPARPVGSWTIEDVPPYEDEED